MIPPEYAFANSLARSFGQFSRHRGYVPDVEHIAKCFSIPREVASARAQNHEWVLQKDAVYFVKNDEGNIEEIMPNTTGWYPHIAFKVMDPDDVKYLSEILAENMFKLIEDSRSDQLEIRWALWVHRPEGSEGGQCVQIIWRQEPLFPV